MNDTTSNQVQSEMEKILKEDEDEEQGVFIVRGMWDTGHCQPVAEQKTGSNSLAVLKTIHFIWSMLPKY